MIEIIPNWHPIFVHFTVALLTVSLGLYLAAMASGSEQLRMVAKWNLWIGSAITLLTLAAGLYAYNTVAHDTPSHEAMTEHRNWALVTVAMLLPLLLWSVLAERRAKKLGWSFVGLFAVVGLLLASTAWHGAEVVYRYGLGVMSLPKTDSHDHASHPHGEAGHGNATNHDDHSHAPESGAEEKMGMDELNMNEMSLDPMPEGDAHHDDNHAH